MFEAITQIGNFLFSLFDGIWSLYTGSFILASVLALFVIRKVVHYFRYITGG